MALAVLGASLFVGGFVVAFRASDAVPGQITPAGAVVELRDYLDEGDYEGAQTRLCSDLEDGTSRDSRTMQVVRLFSDHDVELADPREPGEVANDRGQRPVGDKATTMILVRPRGEAQVEPQRWVVHLQRDPGGSGPMSDRSLRWRVCRVDQE